MPTSAVAQTRMNSLWNYIDSGAMNAAIDTFRSLDVLPTILDYVLDPDSYVYPQGTESAEAGEIIIPETKIAVLALSANQSLDVKLENPVHAIQRQRLQAEGISQVQIKTFEKALAEETTVLRPGHDLLGLASVYTRICNWEGANILGMPSVLFKSNQAGTEYCDDPSLTMHELVHVAQRLMRPHVRFASRKHQDELEAYAVPAASIVADYRIPYTDWAKFAAEIDLLRQRTIGPGLYVPTSEFYDATSRNAPMRAVFSPN